MRAAGRRLGRSFCAAALCVAAAAVSPVHAEPALASLAGGTNPELSSEGTQALARLANNRPGGGHPAIPPVIGQDGTVQYLFGAQDPDLVCAPFRICDIALQPGEEITSINCGDVVRWQIDPANAGADAFSTAHVFVSPRDIGLQTSLVITTNRNRTYHIRLTSHLEKYMPRISFIYPDDLSAKLLVVQAQRRQRKATSDAQVAASTLPDTGEHMADLSFAYECEGRAPWKPVRVYNDGRKTIIQLPPATEHTEAPSFFVLRTPGGLFDDEELVQVNYRIASTREGPRYLVDSIFDNGVLVAGVGRNQVRVHIKRLR